MTRQSKLAGALLADMIGGTQASPDPLPPRARNGGTDPQSIVELLAYEIPFRTEPAVGVVFPPETEDAETDDAE